MYLKVKSCRNYTRNVCLIHDKTKWNINNIPITSFFSVQTLLKCRVWSLRMSKANPQTKRDILTAFEHAKIMWFVLLLISNWTGNIPRKFREEALQIDLSRGLKINEIWVVQPPGNSERRHFKSIWVVLWKLMRFESCTVVETVS